MPVLVVLASCSFSTRVDPVADAPETTSDAPIDAPPPDPDAPPLPPCKVGVATTPGTNRGRVGGTGGGANFGPMRCSSATSRIVGFAARMSDNNTLYGARSARAFLIACAEVTIDPNTGTGTTGTVTTVEVSGSGAEGWNPATLTPVTQCPAGMVVDGLRVHTGTNGNLFKDIDFKCSRVDGVTAMTSSPVVLDVAGTLTEPNGTETVNCAANEILYELPNLTGSGFDSVELFCAPATCTP